MNPYFLIGLAGAALLIWTIGAYSFYRISRAQKSKSLARDIQPALRMAEQWMAEAQRKMEQFAQTAEQPLGAAQNELLELRLEAGRLPQGIKNLRLVRESLDTVFKPAGLNKPLSDIVTLYLGSGDFRVEGPSIVFWKTPLGDMPCLEMEAKETLSDDRMKAALARLNQALNQSAGQGGFLYFADPIQYQACLQNPQWMAGLKSLRLMVVDFTGLTALLASLRLAKDADEVIQTFREGVESTRALTGQSDKMNATLSRLSGHALKIRTVMEGSVMDALESKEKQD